MSKGWITQQLNSDLGDGHLVVSRFGKAKSLIRLAPAEEAVGVAPAKASQVSLLVQ